jgi:hypothetical protein
MAAFDLAGKVKLTLITNGSLMGRDYVQRGIARFSEIGGEIWFKFDRALAESRRFINGADLSNENIANNLRIATSLCPTWIQTCVFALDGDAPSDAEREAYIAFIKEVVPTAPIKGVLLYGLARESMQPEARRLSRLPAVWLEDFATAVRGAGVEVKVSP